MTGWSLVSFSLGFDFDENLSNIFNKAICCLTCRPNREELFKVLGVVYLHFQLVWGSDFSEDFWWWYWDGSNMGYSRKKCKRLGHTFSKKTLKFLGLSFYPCKFQTKKSFILGSSAKWCYSLWKFQDQKPRPMEIPHVFLITPGNSNFLINTWNFHMPFLLYLWKFHVLNSPSLDFSGVAQ